MICEECGIEFGGAECPRCFPDQAKLADMLMSPDGIAENVNVSRLKSRKCRFCLKQMVCQIIGKAKKAGKGQIVGGLFIAREYSVSGVWEVVLDCRIFLRIPAKRARARKQKDAGFVGDLFKGEGA